MTDLEKTKLQLEAKMEGMHQSVIAMVNNTLGEIRQDIKALREAQTNATINEHGIENIIKNFKEEHKRIHEVTEKILAQTTKTNGRVTLLESWKEMHKVKADTTRKTAESAQSTLRGLAFVIVMAVIGAGLTLVLK